MKFNGRSLVVLGFPKCGTSALMRSIEADGRATVLRNPSGNLEYAWPLIQEYEEASPSVDTPVVAHKYTAYAYLPGPIDILARDPERRFVLCVRDPAKSLISWMLMHRSIAESDRMPEHFAYQERDFYANCSVDEYYERFAAKRLEYADILRSIIASVGSERLVVVSQERMSDGIGDVAKLLLDFAVNSVDAERWQAGRLEAQANTHVSRAEKAGIKVSTELKAKLKAIYEDMNETIRTQCPYSLI